MQLQHTVYSYLASHADVLRVLSCVSSPMWGEEMRDETLRMSAWVANSYQKLDLFQIVPGSTPQLRLKIASGSVCCQLGFLISKTWCQTS